MEAAIVGRSAELASVTGLLDKSGRACARSSSTAKRGWARSRCCCKVSRRPPGEGWALTDIVCDDPDGGTTVSLGNRRANIDLDPGETVVCTFTNTRT
jgi:hypothetical protein